MAYVIGETCVDVLDRACVDECPVDCIYEGENERFFAEPLPGRDAPLGLARRRGQARGDRH